MEARWYIMWKKTQWQKTLEHEGEPVLSLSLTLPAPTDDSRSSRRMEGYYAHLGQMWQTRWTSTLYPQAAAALIEARAQSRPFQPWDAEVTYCVCLEREDLSSLYVDAIERRGGTSRPITVRSSETWDPRNGIPQALSSLCPRHPFWKRPLVKELQRQVQEQLQGGESLFYENAVARSAKYFSHHRFYLAEEGLAIFYPMCSLGSPAEGIPVFLLPLPDLLQNFPPKVS